MEFVPSHPPCLSCQFNLLTAALLQRAGGNADASRAANSARVKE
jgi:hypothetical protein